MGWQLEVGHMDWQLEYLGVGKLYMHRYSMAGGQSQRHRVMRFTASECLEGAGAAAQVHPNQEAEVPHGVLNMETQHG